MIYTEENRKKLESILKAFEKYIDSQDYFDILYSQKVGYLWVVVNPPGGAGAEQLDTPKRMLDVIFNEVINDVINSPENRSHIPEASTLTGWEEAESRRQLTAILNRLKVTGLSIWNTWMSIFRAIRNATLGMMVDFA